MAVGAGIFAGCALFFGVLAVATWGDGDPTPWIWISLVCAPVGLVTSVVAQLGHGGRTALTALAVSAVVSAFWLFIFISLLFGG